MKNVVIAAAVLFCTAAVALAGPLKKKAAAPAAPRPPAASAGYRPAGTVAFANLETIARTVAAIPGPKATDPILTRVVPGAIRGQGVARLFGPMRPGAHGVAVCYVDPAVASPG